MVTLHGPVLMEPLASCEKACLIDQACFFTTGRISRAFPEAWQLQDDWLWLRTLHGET